jgi:hypothetical protein
MAEREGMLARTEQAAYEELCAYTIHAWCRSVWECFAENRGAVVDFYDTRHRVRGGARDLVPSSSSVDVSFERGR